MPRVLSMDLRERVLAAVEAGSSCRQAAERFGVGIATAIRWQARFRAEGVVAAKPVGGDQRSGRTEAHAEVILQACEAQPQAYRRELRDSLREKGVTTSTSGLYRFFARHGITRKCMARPVGKRLLGSSLNCLHKHIRPSSEPLAKMESRASWSR